VVSQPCFTETAEAEKISMARSILKELLRRKAVVLYFRDETSDGEAEMAEDAALDVLSVDANWATPDVVGKEYRYMNTEKGDRALSKIWRVAKS
jgi:hypothetical protein